MNLSVTMPLTIVVFVAFLATTFSYDIRTNQYVDTLLGDPFRNEMKTSGMDPAQLTDIKTEDKDKFMGIKTNVATTYKDGLLYGLSRIYRQGDCSNLYYRNGNPALNCTLHLPSLQIKYDARVKYGITPKVTIHNQANVTNLTTFLEVLGPARGFPARINFFGITALPAPQMKYTGLGPLNKGVAKILTRSFVSAVTPQINYAVTVQLRNVLDRKVPHVSFPM